MLFTESTESVRNPLVSSSSGSGMGSSSSFPPEKKFFNFEPTLILPPVHALKNT